MTRTRNNADAQKPTKKKAKKKSKFEETVLVEHKDTMHRFLHLRSLKEQLNAQLGEVQEEMNEVEASVLGQLEELGTDGVRVIYGDNRFTISPRRQVYISPKDGDYETACTALTKLGYGDIIGRRFNVATVASIVRELQDEAGDESDEHQTKEKRNARKTLEALSKFLNINEVFKVGVRKS
jgi:hypothetical protein